MKKPVPISKEDRLAEALRANLRRRKASGAPSKQFLQPVDIPSNSEKPKE